MFRIKYYATASLSLYPEGRVHFVDPIDDSSFEIRGLKASTKYKFAIQSLNDIGESEYTTPLEAMTEVGKNQPLVDGLTDTSSQSVPIIVTISVGICATLLLLLSVVLITCLVHKRRVKGTTSTSRSFSSDTSGKPSVQDGFTGSQGTSCYNDTMSEETMSYISERSGSFISPAERASGVPNVHGMMDEGYHPHAASTYLTEHIGGIYNVEQGREIGFSSHNLPLSKSTIAFATEREDTESQYADELRRQAYIQTLGDGYNISQIGSSISYPNSPTAEYYSNDGMAESELQDNKGEIPPTMPHLSSRLQTEPAPHHHHFSRPAGNTALIGPAATLGRHSGRFGKSPFRVVVPGNSSNSGTTPPVCSTPQNSLPLLDSLDSRERTLPEFSTFGGNVGYNVHQTLPKPRNESIEPSGHLV